MDKEDKISLLLEKAPIECAGILASTEKEKGNNLTMDNLEEAMTIQCCIRYCEAEDKGSDGKEVTLAAFNE
eukprot:1575153-Ditylum_brightwellii.AAC.1